MYRMIANDHKPKAHVLIPIRFVLLTIVEHYHVVQCSAGSRLIVNNHGGVILTAAISSLALRTFHGEAKK